MRRLLATDPHRHLLEHAAIVFGFALLALWWWILLKDGPTQFGSFAFLAEIASHPTGGIFFPTIMMVSRPTGAGAVVVGYASFAGTALVWMNGTVWLTIALAGPIRHKLCSYSATSGRLGFRRALPEYLIAAGISAMWGSFKYSQLIAVTADEAQRFLFLYALPATSLPLAIMILRRWVMGGRRWMRARSAADRSP